MSLSSLISGADCGPSNALQSLTKRVDADRGIQEDFFGAGRPSTSRQIFRTQMPLNQDLHSEQERFFSASSRPAFQPPVPQGAFDLSAMGQALPMREDISQIHNVTSMQGLGAHGKGKGKTVDWAADFLQEGVQPSQMVEATGLQAQKSNNFQPIQASTPVNQFMKPNIGFLPMPPPVLMSQGAPVADPNAALWEQEFLQHHRSLEETVGQTASNPVHVDNDELSRTAGLLVDSLKDEENPKFKNSEFMGFMRQLRDKEMIVDGEKIVPSSEATTSTKGQHTSITTASTSLSNTRLRASTIDGWPMKSVHFDPVATTAAPSQLKESFDASEGLSEEDAYWQAENRDYREYWENASLPMHTTIPAVVSSQAKEWGAFQESWDQWEATATGMKQTTVPHYRFQANNPYISGAVRQQQHPGKGADLNLLESEAAVLKDPQNAEAWYQLGVKQQSNEREDKAIQAFRKAVELDPSLLHAWMELAVSYTNEGNRTETYASILEWIGRNTRYADIVTKWNQTKTFSDPPDVQQLTDCLVAMATSMADGELDPDVQIALGVLLNTTEDYEKARDCFLAALDARPDDHLLYNRIGATMANHGQSSNAIPYYHRALALNPSYIRARFNLGISYITLQRYQEAAEHILDALVLQENDGLERGVTSSALWETLRNVCLNLHRHDLANICNRRDLNSFRSAFFSSKD